MWVRLGRLLFLGPSGPPKTTVHTVYQHKLNALWSRTLLQTVTEMEDTVHRDGMYCSIPQQWHFRAGIWYSGKPEPMGHHLSSVSHGNRSTGCKDGPPLGLPKEGSNVKPCIYSLYTKEKSSARHTVYLKSGEDLSAVWVSRVFLYDSCTPFISSMLSLAQPLT